MIDKCKLLFHHKLIDRSIAWRLIERAGPVIRYRTLNEILQVSDVEIISNSLERLFDSLIVRQALDFLQSVANSDSLANRASILVSAIARLSQLGVMAGLQQLDALTIGIRAMLADNVIIDTNARVVIAEALSFAGYYSIPIVRSVVIQRLQNICTSTHDAHPRFHDVLGFSNINLIKKDNELRQLAERVTSIITNPEYQEMCQNERYNGADALWNFVILPGFYKSPEIDMMGSLILKLDLLAPFESVRETKWFKESMRILERRRSDDGLYRFPHEWLPDGDITQWPEGKCMSLDETRDDDTLAYESTFRVIKIKSYQ